MKYWKKRDKYLERADELYRKHRSDGLDDANARSRAVYQARKEVYSDAT